MVPRKKRFRKSKPVHPLLHKTIQPFREFLRIEASSGILIMLFLIAALVWVNLPFGSTYDVLWGTHIQIIIGSLVIEGPLVFWINDFLMAIFFFLIGLEIKRELRIAE